MSFTCDRCNTPQETLTRPIQVVTKIVIEKDRDGIQLPGWKIGKVANVCSPCNEMMEIPIPPPRFAR